MILFLDFNIPQFSQLVATNTNLSAEEDERVLNSDVIKTLTSSLGFNFSEVITSVQKHRPSRAFAAYELLSRKAERTATKSNVVSLRDVRNEMERNRAKPKNQSGESDSGFENKSSSSETDVANKNLKKSTKKKQTEISLDVQDIESTNKKETSKAFGPLSEYSISYSDSFGIDILFIFKLQNGVFKTKKAEHEQFISRKSNNLISFKICLQMSISVAKNLLFQITKFLMFLIYYIYFLEN